MEYYVFFVTVPNLEEAKNISKQLVEERLVACVNIVRDIISTYRWEGNIEIDNEFLLIIKTTENMCEPLINRIQEIHSYSNPECIALKIEKGSNKYLNWINEVTKQ